MEPGFFVGTSDWVSVTQQMIDSFGVATLDADPMHVDPEWAQKKGPYGKTIAFGFQTASLLTHLLHSAVGTSPVDDPDRTGYFLNYGFDRMRLIQPVPVDSRVRGAFKVLHRRMDDAGRIIMTFHCEVELDGSDRPAMVAEWLTIWVPPAPGR